MEVLHPGAHPDGQVARWWAETIRTRGDQNVHGVAVPITRSVSHFSRDPNRRHLRGRRPMTMKPGSREAAG